MASSDAVEGYKVLPLGMVLLTSTNNKFYKVFFYCDSNGIVRCSGRLQGSAIKSPSKSAPLQVFMQCYRAFQIFVNLHRYFSKQRLFIKIKNVDNLRLSTFFCLYIYWFKSKFNPQSICKGFFFA